MDDEQEQAVNLGGDHHSLEQQQEVGAQQANAVNEGVQVIAAEAQNLEEQENAGAEVQDGGA